MRREVYMWRYAWMSWSRVRPSNDLPFFPPLAARPSLGSVFVVAIRSLVPALLDSRSPNTIPRLGIPLPEIRCSKGGSLLHCKWEETISEEAEIRTVAVGPRYRDTFGQALTHAP